MHNSTMDELKQLAGEYFATKGSYKEKLDAAYTKFNEFPITDEAVFWKHLVYAVAASADTAVRAMRQQHENMLAFKFELDRREEEFGFPHKSPLDIKSQWEAHKKAMRERMDELRKQREQKGKV